MNTLKQLIQQYCPEGVEYKKLEDVCNPLKKGTLKITELIENGKFPVINSGRDLYGYYDNWNNDGNAFTVAARGEYAGFVNFFSQKFWAGGLCYPYRSKDEKLIITKYVFYALKNKEFFVRHSIVADGGIPALNKSSLDNLEIPIPPIEVQRKIVQILDNFTALEAELEAELEARKKQYNYYRDQLLSFKNLTGGGARIMLDAYLLKIYLKCATVIPPLNPTLIFGKTELFLGSEWMI